QLFRSDWGLRSTCRQDLGPQAFSPTSGALRVLNWAATWWKSKPQPSRKERGKGVGATGSAGILNAPFTSKLIKEMGAHLFVEQAALDVEQLVKRRLIGPLGRDVFFKDLAKLSRQVLVE